ncbi:hypothetical protein EZV62_003516 [Acer yangbiense]|uniref:PGG domain-containing protein n=1 Tax=Acer yangbiense TaxID=1000413 RepID=A0A5C7IHJ1_9ROSI|nr:hypothetical protein EZV62_003516 [Acer yangbiense]
MLQQQAESTGGVQPPNHGKNMSSNLGETSHQPQLSEAQIAVADFYLISHLSHFLLPDSSRFFYFASHLKSSITTPFPPPSPAPPEASGWDSDNPLAGGGERRWTGERLNYYRPLYLAAQRGDWKNAKSFIEHDPNALTATISPSNSQTVVHVAALCCQWGFVLKLLEFLSPESIAVQDSTGCTVLHYVAQGGSLMTAKSLVQKNSFLSQMVNNQQELPLLHSIWSESKEMVWYLSLITRVDSPTFPFFIPTLPRILRHLVKSGFHDIALYFVQRYPNLALAEDEYKHSLLRWLAYEPAHFVSGSNLGFIERWIYKCKYHVLEQLINQICICLLFYIAKVFNAFFLLVQVVRVEIKNAPTQLEVINMRDILENTQHFPALQSRSFATRVLRLFKTLLWKASAQLAPSIKMVRDAKLKYECAVELVNHVCMKLHSMRYHQIMYFFQNPEPILGNPVTGGIEEIVRTLLQHFPYLIDYDVLPERNILKVAIECRQEKIVNMVKEISPITTKNLCSPLPDSGNSALHLGGKLAPPFKLFSVSGAALQMQRELQWFKEVEKITLPADRDRKIFDNETAKDVFRKEHKELAEQGEKWMKDTANSCMLVSTLIATVLFAAVFTVPGGNNNDKGIPIFLRMNAFTIFIISDALGLFSSLTSLLMFLAILTARYGVEDFLESLPKKLIIGLGSLFVAIAAMIIAFVATLTIVLSERWHLVFVPITLVASFPVAIFVMLQLPLFVQMVQTTYGASIFCPWPSRV